MLMIQDGIEVYCLPDGACCEVDENHRSPLDLDDCPLGYETCNGNCFYYAECIPRASGGDPVTTADAVTTTGYSPRKRG